MGDDNSDAPDRRPELGGEPGHQGIENRGAVRSQINIHGEATFNLGDGAKAATMFTLGTVVAGGLGTSIAGIATALLIVWFCAFLYDRYRERP